MQHREPIILLEDIGVSYGSQPVLHHISHTVFCGERVIITGPNGSGKTTLLRVLSGSLIPQSGKVIVLGKNLADNKNRQEIRRSIGVLTQVQQEPEIAITVIESVLLGLWGTKFGWYRRAKKADYQQAFSHLESVEMDQFAQRDIRTLSGGQRQRIALARALIRNPQLVLMDEPTTYLDAEAKKDILQRIHDLQKQYQFTSIIVSHEALGEQASERIVRIEKGTIYPNTVAS